MKRVLTIIAALATLVVVVYFAFIYYVPFSEGMRSGELIKISHKGVIMKTWEGELSQGISGAQIFTFSVLDADKQVITDLQNLQGQYVKLSYVEKYRTFSWWGETRYFITAVQKEKSPFNQN
ncbi:6-phosphogluconate dehydrogenase [Flavobacterium restrictum]|uniref:6-phosphogluconate dehydrogenase n=1 Tax=Flavobacterium restrictum TaxID=2594428 RepID=A0A553E2P8_9FLAO|nr:6-phosphogluconate dehydrogenase [Flavobacterium restrictum]TRX39255.1 6-phosphogluconate dehydrogenase [Flavobacterium restrictum]